MSQSFLHRFMDNDRSVSAEEAARVFDSLDQVSDAKTTTFAGKNGRSLTTDMEKDRGFFSTLGKIAGDSLKELGLAALDDLAGFFGSSLEDLKKIVGYEQLKSYFDRVLSKKIDLTRLDDNQIQQLIDSIKQTKSFKDKGSLIQFLDTELKSHKRQREEAEKAEKAKMGSKASTEAQKQIDEDVKRVEKAIDKAVSAIPDEELPDEGSADAEEGGFDEKLPLPALVDLRPIIYGRVDLPKGVYLLSVSGTQGESSDDKFAFSFYIEKVIKWKEYKAYVSATQKKDADLTSLDELADSAIDSELSTRFEGTDFLDYLKNNEVSGDLEVDFGYLPMRDGRFSLMANVNKTNNAFTISAPAEVVSSMFVPFSVGK